MINSIRAEIKTDNVGIYNVADGLDNFEDDITKELRSKVWVKYLQEQKQ